MLEPGTELGSYRVIERVGAGGMGEVHLAVRRGIEGFVRPVVIKRLHAHLASDRRLVELFLDEARLAARVQHAHVVGVEDCGEHGGAPFLVLPYVHGVPLARVLEAAARMQRRISIDLAVKIAVHVADGLHAVHELADEAGRPLAIVHRDVSPTNVLLGLDGHVGLTDFGVAKSRQRVRDTTAGATLRGKLGYMAPEQVRADAVDRTTDVYGLGVVLWEMLTGRRLFEGTIASIMRRLERGEVDPPSKHRAGIAPALDDVVLGALAPKSDQRLPSARALRRALVAAVPPAAALDDEPQSVMIHALFGPELAALRARLPSGAVTATSHEHATDDAFELEPTTRGEPPDGCR